MLDTINTEIEIKPRVQFLINELILPDDLSRQEWDDVWLAVRTANAASQWWIGDCLNFGERKYGETYTQALEQTDLEYESLRVCKWVSSKIETVLRRTVLSWSHHKEVAGLPVQQMNYWLDLAERDKLSVNDLRRAIKGGAKESAQLLEGDFSWFKDPEYKKAQEFLKPEYRHFLDRLNDKDETSSATQYAAHMEYRWMMERCKEIERKWGVPE